MRHPCRPLLLATFNPEENELREHLMDRIGIRLSADAEPLDKDERLEAVQRALDFSVRPPSRGETTCSASPFRDFRLRADVASTRQVNPRDMVKKFEEVNDQMKTSILFAREYLKNLTPTIAQKQYLCEEASRAGSQGHRGELFAIQARPRRDLGAISARSSADLGPISARVSPRAFIGVISASSRRVSRLRWRAPTPRSTATSASSARTSRWAYGCASRHVARRSRCRTTTR